MAATIQCSTVVGVFNDRASAERAVTDLRQAGFRDDQIGFMARDASGQATAQGKESKGTNAGEGALAGVLAGAGVGGLVGLGVISGVIPVIGPAIAAGALATILTNAAAGAAIAGLAGALIGLGIPEEEARYYEGELKAGRFLVTVRAESRCNEAQAILVRHGAYNLQNQAGTCASTSAMGAAGQTMQVREEELHARKQPVQTGEVRVHKEVVTEHKTLDVPVMREEVVVERRPASGQACSSAIREGEEIRIPVKEEQVQVEKQAVVKEEVAIGKRKIQDTEKVSGTVRKEQVRVEKEGDVDVHGTTVNKGGRTPRK